jgi:phosphate transport system substrate-binding protein
MTFSRFFTFILFVGSIFMASPGHAIDLKYAGSTTVQLGFMYDAATAYKLATDKRISIMGGSSGGGVRGVVLGTIDIGGTSRELNEREKTMGVVSHQLGWDAIAMIVNKQNRVANLSMEQLERIFTGRITNWQQVGGDNAPIVVVTSHEGSATKEVIHEIVMKKSAWAQNALMVNSTRDELDKVVENPYAIGGVSVSFADKDKIKIITVDGVTPDPANINNQTYKIARSLNLVTMGPASGEAKNFIDFMLSPQGQNIVAQKFIPVK